VALARELIRAKSWDAPSDQNVRKIVAELSESAPDLPELADLKQEAAERALADALGLKVAGRISLAARRVELALQWIPGLAGAQPLLDELKKAPLPQTTDGFEFAPKPRHLSDSAPLFPSPTSSPAALMPAPGEPPP